jgi:hypothetical protein
MRQAAHYTEYPVMFQQVLPKFVEHKTFIFCGVHYLHLFTWLMTKRYDKLAAHLVNLDGVFKSDEEAIELMRLRTRQFDIKSLYKKPEGVKLSTRRDLVSN